MRCRHIEQLDLNLLKLLDALLASRSVTHAAERLGIGQPAASRALARLRKALDDPLLVRGTGGYRLTPHAEQLRPAVSSALCAIDRVFAPAAFDPMTSERSFTIASTDYGTLSVLQDAAPAILRSAPRARLDVVAWDEHTLAALADAQIDLALYADDPLPLAYSYQRLFAETFTCLYRRGHPVDQRARRGSIAARLRALGSFPQAVIAYPSGRITQFDDVLGQLGLPHERIALSLPYFLAAPGIVAKSDLVLIAPTRVAERLAPVASLQSLPFPIKSFGFEYRMVWHERMHRDLAHRWLRDIVSALVKSDVCAWISQPAMVDL